MRLAMELLFAVLRKREGGEVSIVYEPSLSHPWNVRVVVDGLVYTGADTLAYRAAAKAYQSYEASHG